MLTLVRLSWYLCLVSSFTVESSMWSGTIIHHDSIGVVGIVGVKGVVGVIGVGGVKRRGEE